MIEKLNLTMLTDFYEITMANGYFCSDMADDIAYFDMFFRRIPDGGGYAIMAGLEQLIEYLKNLEFTDEDIEYLRAKKLFDERFLEYLADFKFTCDVWAVPEGTPIFPGEPLITVRGPVMQAQTAGLIMIFQPLIMALLSPVAGRLSDRFSPFRMSSLGMALCAAGTFMFIFTGLQTHLVCIIAALVVTGLGFAMFSSPNTNAVMSCVEKEDYGVASSILATMRSIGHTFSMVIVTITVTVLASDMALADVPADVLIKVIRVSFIVFTAICIAGVFISLKRE